MSKGPGVRIGKPIVLRWFAVAVIAVGAIVGAFYVTTHGHDVSQQLTLATTRQPERFTELSFADPGKIPATANPGQTVPVSFTLHNQESQDMSYTYTVTFTDNKGSVSTFASNTVLISNNQSQTITHDVVVPAGKGRGQVGVQLINKGQSVHFWLERI